MTLKTRPIDKVISKLVSICEEHSVLPWNCPYLKPDIIPPQNPVTKTVYSGGNRIYLSVIQWLQDYETPFFVTFNGAKALGGNVKKGQSGYPILVAKPVYKRENEKEDEDSKELTTKEQIYFGTATVFNLDQCENIDMAPFYKSLENPVKTHIKTIPELEFFVKSVNPLIVTGQIPAYTPFLDVIKMPEIESFVSAELYYQTLFHEMIHWTGHESRLNREFGNVFGSEKYSKEELIAEIGAAFLTNFLIGENTTTMYQSSAYVKSWLTVLKGNPQMLFKSSADSEKAVDYLLKLGKIEQINPNLND